MSSDQRERATPSDEATKECVSDQCSKTELAWNRHRWPARDTLWYLHDSAGFESYGVSPSVVSMAGAGLSRVGWPKLDRFVKASLCLSPRKHTGTREGTALTGTWLVQGGRPGTIAMSQCEQMSLAQNGQKSAQETGAGLITARPTGLFRWASCGRVSGGCGFGG